MHNILIVGALDAELKIIKEEVKKLNFKNIKVSFLLSGIGNYNTILNLTKYLQENTFDLILNIGVCGYKNIKKDFIQVGRIKNLSNNKELIVPNIISFGELVSIASSESIVFDREIVGEENFVDMESYGFELVCNSFEIPRIILKIPVDKIGKETKNFDFKKAKKYLKENIDYELLFKEVEKYLDKNLIQFSVLDKKNQKIKNKILSDYRFSVSEKIILEKKINKFIVLEFGNIDIFFEENKNLNKKDFFKKLEG